jgi:hypothetical protein
MENQQLVWRERQLSVRRKTQMRKPDLRGEWTLNGEASALSPVVPPVVQGGFVKDLGALESSRAINATESATNGYAATSRNWCGTVS